MVLRKASKTAIALMGVASFGLGSPVAAGLEPSQVVIALYDSGWSEWNDVDDLMETVPVGVTAVIVGLVPVPSPTPDCVDFGQPVGVRTAFEFVFDVTPCFVGTGSTSDVEAAVAHNEIAEFAWFSIGESGAPEVFRCLDVDGTARTEGDFSMRVNFGESEYFTVGSNVASIAAIGPDRIFAMSAISTDSRLQNTPFVAFQLDAEYREGDLEEDFVLFPGDGVWTVGLEIDECRSRGAEALLDRYLERSTADEQPDTL